MPSREYLMLTEESTYGLPVSGPTKGVNLFYARLHEADSFTGQMDIVPVTFPYGGGRATPANLVFDQYKVDFKFKTYLYGGKYSSMLINWLMTPIDSGRANPWSTSDPNNLMPPGDLASLSFYHAIQQNDGSYDLRRYGGAKPDSWSISCSRGSPLAVLTVSGKAIRDNMNGAGVVAYPNSTEFPAPNETDYPLNPYLFSNTGGNIQIGTVRTQYNSFTLSCTNAMDARWFESQYMQFTRFLGRTTTLSMDLFMKLSPSDITAWQTAAQQTVQLAFNNGTNSMTFTFNTRNFYTSLGRSLPLNQVFTRSPTITNMWDQTAGNDISVTTT